MKQNVTFKTTLEFDASAHPAGEEIAIAIQSALAKRRIKTGGIDNHGDYSWSVDVTINEKNIWLQVGHIDDDPYDWLLAIRTDVGFIGRLLGKNDENERNILAEELHAMMTENESYSEVRWHEGEYSDNYSNKP